MKQLFKSLIAFVLITLKIVNIYALDLRKEITIRPLTIKDEKIFIDQFVESFMSAYKDQVFVVTKNNEYVLLTNSESDALKKQEWILSAAKSEFDEYVQKNNNKSFKSIGVLQNGKLIGGLLYRIIDHKTIYLAQLFIAPKYQKQGISFYVLNNLFPKLYPSCKRYEVFTRHQNYGAILLYKKLGYKIGSIDILEKYKFNPLMYMSFFKDIN